MIDKCLYNLYLNVRMTDPLVFSTNDQKEMWDRILELPFGTGYEVLDADGYSVREFIPFWEERCQTFMTYQPILL